MSAAPVLTPARLMVSIPRIPPTVNHMYQATRGGGKALTAEAAAFRQEAGLLIRAAATRQGFAVPDGPLAIDLCLVFPTRRRADLDNRAKAAIDALAIALGFDDERVRFITLQHGGYARGEARTVITLEAYR